jgi:N-acetylmuramic acid 6-phosphate etherase
MDYHSKAEAFLKVAPQFKLGELDTEKPHPKTSQLSALVEEDLPQAVSILREVDLDALEVIRHRAGEISRMKAAIEDVLAAGKRVFLTGCGSTGRLSHVLEVLWRKEREGTSLEDSVIAFMAGGDTALIKAIEDFEDYPDRAHRQLVQMGFAEGDMLIASTEGGETPFVIGATEKAAELSRQRPWFLYCNPDDQLMGLTDRTTRILNHPGVIRINLSTGPMALSGSTRMQASTVLMYAIGLALLNAFGDLDAAAETETLISFIRQADYGFIGEFINRESEHYKKGDYLVYSTHDDLGICVLTDTTERAPTFSLKPFENFLAPEPSPSLVYLCLPGTGDSPSAWKKLLGRDPRPLDWEEYPITSSHVLPGFDFSSKLPEKRKALIGGASLPVFDISRSQGIVTLMLDDLSAAVPLPGLNLLHQHLLLKMLLNLHSTLVMGKLGRYEGNLMTYVRPSNNKLIDRAARYIMILLERSGVRRSYEEVIHAIYELIVTGPQTGEYLPDTDPIVLKTIDHLRR